MGMHWDRKPGVGTQERAGRILSDNNTSTVHKQKRIAILGSTGSIGVSTLDVVDALPDRLKVAGLCAHKNTELLLEQAKKYKPEFIVVTDAESAGKIRRDQLPKGTHLLHGAEAVVEMVQSPSVDVVVSAIVGAAGLEGTWAALEAGKEVALANKETLVVAGPLVMELARAKKTHLLPVDSEHSAIFQAMQGSARSAVKKVVLTGSGGPFRGKKAHELEHVTPAQALKHPTWQMGPKITIDSATLMNKALEVIEARWLFGLESEQIGVIVHPESVIHSFVEFADGSVLAQASPPDMRLPIQYALTYPERHPGPTRKLDWMSLRSWNFEQPDMETFPALGLGLEVARQGGTCGAVLNAANEEAVSRFLKEEIAFLDIARACRAALDHHEFSPRPTLEELYKCDRWARQEIDRWTRKKTTTLQNR